jgi:signal transduction histidine kinase
MTASRIDWSQLWYPGPKRAFTTEEMARAGGAGPSRTFLLVMAVNLVSIVWVALLMAPAGQRLPLAAVLAVLVTLGVAAAAWLWSRPWRWPLMVVSLGLAASLVALAVALRWWVPEREARLAAGLPLAVGCAVLVVLMWFLVIWRAQDIEAKLREQAEREKSMEMARRLANAQIEPHFLFNTLASVQHWVQTKDDRAAPLLDALTGYLRATLPLFNRPVLAAADELLAVRRYLAVMQARLGARLQFVVDIDPAVEAVCLPPGVLLTLVENAVAHGIEPQIAGGQISVQGQQVADAAVFSVQDNGPGPVAGMAEGVGLSNARQRLFLTCGPHAQLHIGHAAQGGCRAEIRLPLKATP